MTVTPLRMPEPTDEDAVRAYTVAQLAELWRVGKTWLYERIERGELPTVEFGDTRAKTRVLHTDALAFLEARRAS